MKAGRIRPLALGVVRDGERILVAEGYDPHKGETFYRPLGGGIKFGESGCDAAVRELREELGATLSSPRYLGMLENIFTYDGKPGHEIILLYEGTLDDPALYATDRIECHEDDGAEFVAVWMPLAGFAPGGPPLYPTGLLELLTALAPAVVEAVR